MGIIRTLIIDDVSLARERIKRCLAGDPEIEIVGECDNGEKAVADIRSLAPDLIFLDVKEIYPRSNGDQDLVLQNGRQLMLSRKLP